MGNSFKNLLYQIYQQTFSKYYTIPFLLYFWTFNLTFKKILSAGCGDYCVYVGFYCGFSGFACTAEKKYAAYKHKKNLMKKRLRVDHGTPIAPFAPKSKLLYYKKRKLQ